MYMHVYSIQHNVIQHPQEKVVLMNSIFMAHDKAALELLKVICRFITKNYGETLGWPLMTFVIAQGVIRKRFWTERWSPETREKQQRHKMSDLGQFSGENIKLGQTFTSIEGIYSFRGQTILTLHSHQLWDKQWNAKLWGHSESGPIYDQTNYYTLY